jgi:hypothetical protein
MHESLNQQLPQKKELKTATSPRVHSRKVLNDNRTTVAEKALVAKGKKKNKDDVLLADFSWEKYLEEIDELANILKPPP